MESKKRVRSTNFTIEETVVLVTLIGKRKEIIENKATNSSTWKEKERAWKAIEFEFRALTGITREAQVLKNKYEHLKKAVRNKLKAINESIQKPEGILSTPKLTALEEKIKGIITFKAESPSEVVHSEQLIIGASYSSELPGTSFIQIKEETQNSLDEPPSGSAFVKIKEETQISIDEPPSPSTSALNEALDVDVFSEAEGEEELEQKRPKVPSEDSFPGLPRRIGNLRHMNILQEKYITLAEKKLELADLEIELKKSELAFKKKMQERKLQMAEEEHFLKMELLRKQLAS